MSELNDWSTHLIKAEKAIKTIEDKLLHRKRDGLDSDVATAVLALYAALDWASKNPDQ